MPKYDDLLREASERFKEGLDSDRAERELSYEDTRFAINDEGCQWNQAVRSIREGDDPPRPCIVLNKIPEKLDQVDGEFRQLRPSHKVVGVDNLADSAIAEIYSGIIRFIEYNSTAIVAYSTCHNSVLHGGRGAWRINIVDCDDDPFVRDIKIARVPNVLTVVWDPGAKEITKSDAEYFFITEELRKKEFETRYPDVPVMDWDSSDKTWMDWRTDETVRIAEYWYKEQVEKVFYRVRRLIGGIPTIITVTDPPSDVAERMLQRYLLASDEKLEEKAKKVPVIKWCLMTAGEIIPHPDTKEKITTWPGKYIPVVVELGKGINIKGQEKTRGMVRYAKEPQQLYNYWSSLVTEQISLAPKAPYLVTANMISKYQSQWDQAHIKNFPYLLFDADPQAGNMGPRREQPPQLSTAVANELVRMEHDIMSSMGIYQASLGDAGQEKSGRAIFARQKQGSTGSYAFTDNFQVSLVYSTQILIDLIPSVYDTERVIRIMGEGGTEMQVPVNARPGVPGLQQVPKQYLSPPREGITEYFNDIGVGKYDIRVKIGPSYTTQREETAAMLADISRTLPPQIAIVLTDLTIKLLDMPGGDEAVQRLRKMMPPGVIDGQENQLTPEKAKQLMQSALDEYKNSIEGQKLQADVAEKQLDLEKKKIDIAIAQLKLEQERIKSEDGTQQVVNRTIESLQKRGMAR